MKVSFIIPLYNCLPLTRVMLASLRATLPASLTHEIILVDDGSTDGTRAWLDTLPRTCRVLLNDRNLGFATTCNRGAAKAAGEFLFFLNSDLVLLPGWLEPMLAAFDRFPTCGLVGNVQLSAVNGMVDHTGVYFNHQGKPAHRTDRPISTRWFSWPAYRKVDALTGACFGLHRSLWAQLDGFDESFVNGCEDIDLVLRATAAGRRHYIALGSIVRHHVSSSPGRNLHNEQNTRRLVQRWPKQIARLAARDWCWQQIIAHAELSGVLNYPLLYAALAHLLFRCEPPQLVRDGMVASLQRERQRWQELLDGVPASPPARRCRPRLT